MPNPADEIHHGCFGLKAETGAARQEGEKEREKEKETE